jgi:bla regulator protein blaR1
MIWWLGAKLVQERERACDEEVLRLGNDPQAYAEGILKVCEFCLESPLACVAGVTGADMKERIHAIMRRHIGARIGWTKKLILAGVGIVALAVPIMIGLMNAPSIKAQEKPKVEGLAYDAVSIKQPRLDYRVGVVVERGRIYGSRVTVKDLMVSAYGVYKRQISGGPAWVQTQRFYIEAKMDESTAAKLEKMSNQQAERQHMLQTVLAERFKLKVHRELKETPVYALVIAKSGFKLKEADPKASVFSKIYYMRNYPLKWNDFVVGSGNPGLHLSSHGIPVSRLVGELNWELDRFVLDKTGLTGNYDIDLKWIRPRLQGAPTEEAGGSLVSADPGPTIFSALEEQLGLKLDAIKAPMDAIVIDHVEKPSEN